MIYHMSLSFQNQPIGLHNLGCEAKEYEKIIKEDVDTAILDLYQKLLHRY